jgi:hypothetical protein
MNCSEFQNRFSDYYDGTGEPAFVSEASKHLDGCPECRRYRDVIEQGLQILRAVPAPAVTDDFLPRLQHRIYHLADGQALARRETSAGSATTTTTALVIAMLIAAAAWSPALMRPPEVVMQPIVVTQPEPRVVGVRTPDYRDLLALETEADPASLIHQGLWDDPLLLTRYSPLTAGRARSRSALRQADLE